MWIAEGAESYLHTRALPWCGGSEKKTRCKITVILGRREVKGDCADEAP